MKAEDLKECPRCMTDDGYERHITETTIRLTGWDGEVKSEKTTFKMGMVFCKCCGVVVLDELIRLRGEK